MASSTDDLAPAAVGCARAGRRGGAARALAQRRGLAPVERRSHSRSARARRTSVGSTRPAAALRRPETGAAPPCAGDRTPAPPPRGSVQGCESSLSDSNRDSRRANCRTKSRSRSAASSGGARSAAAAVRSAAGPRCPSRGMCNRALLASLPRRFLRTNGSWRAPRPADAGAGHGLGDRGSGRRRRRASSPPRPVDRAGPRPVGGPRLDAGTGTEQPRQQARKHAAEEPGSTSAVADREAILRRAARGRDAAVATPRPRRSVVMLRHRRRRRLVTAAAGASRTGFAGDPEDPEPLP